MIISIVSIIINVIYYVVLNLQIYTDKSQFPDGSERVWQRSPIERLNLNDTLWMLYLQIFISLVCVITSIMIIAGIKNQVVRIVQIVSAITSLIMFIIIMIATGNTHAKYA